MSIVSFVVGRASGADGGGVIWLFRVLEKEKASAPQPGVAGGDAIVLAGHGSTLSSAGTHGKIAVDLLAESYATAVPAWVRRKSG
jgi:hypothetical protein